MRLTKIQKQAKAKDRYSLFVDDQFWLGVHEDVLIQFDLFRPQDLTPDQMTAISQAAFEKSIFHKAISYISYAMRTEAQVVTYLNQEFQEEMDQGIDQYHRIQEVIKETIHYLKENGYINDALYLDQYIKTQESLSPKGNRVLKQDLLKRGLSPDQIQSALSQRDPDQIKADAQHLADRFLRAKSHLPIRKREEKLREMLYRKGFDSSLIQEILQTLDMEVDDQAEYQALAKEGDKALAKWQRKLEGYELKQKVRIHLHRKGFNSDQIRDWMAAHLE